MAEDTKALWREFRQSKDRALRDRLILTYAPLVKFVAGRLGSGLPAHVDEGDLVSYGLLGLIGAIERFDPDRDVKFETYAISRIKGAIIDELRAMDWVPRSVRARARDIERAISALEAKLHRAPTDEEIAEKLGITTDDLDDSLTDISRGWTTKSGIIAPSRPEEARSLLQVALDTALLHNDLALANTCFGNLSDLSLQRDRYADSLALLEEAARPRAQDRSTGGPSGSRSAR